MTIPNLTLEQRTAFTELLASKDQDVLKEMLSLVYDAAIRAQFDEHIGADPHERTSERRDLRNGSRTRGLNTRAGSLDLEIPRARKSNFRPTVSSSSAAANGRWSRSFKRPLSPASARARWKACSRSWVWNGWRSRR